MMSREELPLAKPRPKWKIEAYATRRLERFYPDRLKEPGATPVEDFLEIQIPLYLPVAVDVASLPYPTEAVTTPDNGLFEARVILDPAVYERLMDGDGRARFTAAHEAAHAIFHRKEIRSDLPNGMPQGLYRKANIPLYNNPEWQANKFAVALLMPAPMVREAAQTLGLNVRALAKTFKVSEMSMGFRLRELGIR
jgi:hypothetical protein